MLNASDSLQHLDPRDAGLARRLVLGVTATKGCLDDFLALSCDSKTKLNVRVRCALRIALFEMLYLDSSANVAVSQGVELVRTQSRGAAGLANAVLRRAAANRDSFLAAEGVDPRHARIVSLARSAGMPTWLARMIEGSLGQEAANELFASQLTPAPVTFHLNPLKPADTAPFALVDGKPVIPGCIAPVDAATYIASGALGAYRAVASDASAQVIATAATRPGTCLEIGAGRGTKTFIMACQAHRAGWTRDHVAVDLYQEKCRMNAQRLIDADLPPVHFASGDARDLDAVLVDIDAAATPASNCRARTLFDTVFLDAPCSGTGTMRRHPEIPWRLTRQDVESSLPQLQLELLCAVASRVADGGELFYATCSVLDSENMGVVQRFLSSPEGSAFHLAPLCDSGIFQEPGFSSAAKGVKRMQNEHGCYASHPAPGMPDGHFCARFIHQRA